MKALPTYLLLAFYLLISYKGAAQNVSITSDGSAPDPAAMLDIKSSTRGLLIPRMNQSQRIAINPAPQGLIVYQTDGASGFYYNASSLPAIQNWYKLINPMDQYWTKSLTGDHMYNLNTGNIGIGNTFPADAGFIVDTKIGATHAIFGRNTTGIAIESSFPGIGFNSYFNAGRKTLNTGYTGLLSLNPSNGDLILYNSSISTATDAASSITPRLTIANNGNIGVEGNTAPVVPLSFANIVGNKISLYGSSTTSNYGFGIQGGLLQMFSSTVGADIAFGYGSSTSFTENMRIKGNGFVGIGLANPANILTVASDNQGITQQSTDGSTKIGFYTTPGAAYLQTVTAHPIYFATANGGPAMTLNTNGNLGIGNAAPVDAGLIVDTKVGATNAMFGRTTTGVGIESSFPGIGFNSYYNGGRKTMSTGYTGLIGLNPSNGDLYLWNSTTSTSTDAAATSTARLTINNLGYIGVEGNTVPIAPLSFANSTGNKISLYGSSATSNYGIGIQGALLQVYTNIAASDIAFGYGGSTLFNENMRIKGNGYVGMRTNTPAFPLDMLGRVRLRNDGASTPGIWFNKPDETQGSFIGQYDATNFGIWGPGAAGSWKFLFDGNDGTLRLGTTQKATGYLLNVGGKVIAEEVRITLRASWPDYVFNKDHTLMPLIELEQFINKNNHLPGFKKASDVEKEGSDIGETQRKMMEKIEELTLYIIQQDKKIDALQKEVGKTGTKARN